jgi:hypothetical protein
MIYQPPLISGGTMIYIKTTSVEVDAFAGLCKPSLH